LFEAAQRRLTEQRTHQITTRTKNLAPLRGILFDADGNPMVPTHATKQGVRYQYYVSRPYLRGLVEPQNETIIRVSAPELEAVVSEALRKFPAGHELSTIQAGSAAQNISVSHVGRIEVRANQLSIWFKRNITATDTDNEGCAHSDGHLQEPALLIPWTKPPAKRFKEMLLPAGTERPRVRPIKVERRAALLKAISRGRAWLGEIVSGTATVEEIASRHRCSIRHVTMTLSMAFIAPALVKAAIEGRLPRGIGVAALREAPAEWSLQFRRLGLAQA
jgi:hypothetical protein